MTQLAPEGLPPQARLVSLGMNDPLPCAEFGRAPIVHARQTVMTIDQALTTDAIVKEPPGNYRKSYIRTYPLFQRMRNASSRVKVASHQSTILSGVPIQTCDSATCTQ